MNDDLNDFSNPAAVEPENKLPDFSFTELPEPIRSNAAAMGWKTPMPVQAKAVPYLMSRRDMIVQSHTGSGKTGAFLIPLIQIIKPDRAHVQALVLVPTRELAGQVFREFEALTKGMNLKGALIYGGVGYGPQLDALRGGAQVVIGTPGRILDHLNRRSLSLRDLHVAIFDEADEMLSMGFYPAMREVRSFLPRERVSWMFSATIPYKVQLLAEEFLTKPEFLSLSSGHETVTTMEHRYYQVPPMEKDLMLMQLIEMENPESAIIFCNTKSEVEYLATALQNRGYNADQISGDLSQKERELAMSRIRNRRTRFLVATDVAARGIDISDLAYVFQYDVPKDTESYLHRAGRTARAGNTGVVITLVANISEKTDIKKIARKYNVDFVEMQIPSQEEVEGRIAERLINLLEERLRTGTSRTQRERMKRYQPLVRSLAETEDEWMLVAMLFDEIYQKEFHAIPEVEQPVGRAKEEPAREEKSDERSRDDRRGDERPRDKREERRREERSRDDRGRDGRSRDDRQRDDRQRDERRRDDRGREEESRDDKPREESEEVYDVRSIQEAPAPGTVGDAAEEPRKKKKRRRRKKKNRGMNQEQGAGAPETAARQESAEDDSGEGTDYDDRYDDRDGDGYDDRDERGDDRYDDREGDGYDDRYDDGGDAGRYEAPAEPPIVTEPAPEPIRRSSSKGRRGGRKDVDEPSAQPLAVEPEAAEPAATATPVEAEPAPARKGGRARKAAAEAPAAPAAEPAPEPKKRSKKNVDEPSVPAAVAEPEKPKRGRKSVEPAAEPARAAKGKSATVKETAKDAPSGTTASKTASSKTPASKAASTKSAPAKAAKETSSKTSLKEEPPKAAGSRGKKATAAEPEAPPAAKSGKGSKRNGRG